ncbi:Spy/CpxP family protein refolding chaperone [Massilia sp. 9096]|uniref:Spy/CpxP family protein refolding chaperone n=1 Tax=Massilia sp. 9096 TaxID=1500894 RepID=UPI000A433B4F|nr:Spy/CpxP family protein refolding chaperone [Massilia sp. 9096]
MKLIRHRMAAALLSTAIGACCAGSAFAAGAPEAPPAEPGTGGPGGSHGFGGPGPGMPGPEMPFDAAPGMPGMHGAHDGLMGHLHGLNLSEAQQDKLFAIHHAAQPEQREHMKAVRKAHEALAELARAVRFDDARAAALSRDLGQAIAAEALLHARTEAQALAVLTPEQRERLQRHRAPGAQMHAGRGAQGQQAPQGQPAQPAAPARN